MKKYKKTTNVNKSLMITAWETRDLKKLFLIIYSTLYGLSIDTTHDSL